jgi:hypothetical protein
VGKSTSFDVLATAKAVGFDEASRKINKLGDDGKKSMSGLVTAALAIGPALIPIAAAAAGAMAGLSAAAAVAVVGFLGIQEAMKRGTALGLQYKAAFAPVVGEFEKLKQIAAQGMFAGINRGLKELQPLFPALNRDTAVFSSQLGAIVGHAAPGLVSMFHQLEPLFMQIGNDLTGGAAKFQAWAKSSDGIRNFVAYAQQQLPRVEQTLGQLITTVSHLAQGFAPFGSTSLQAIRLFSTAINAIPIGTLQVLVPLLVGAALGFKAMSAASGAATGLEKFATKSAMAGGVAGKSAGLVSGLGKAVGFLGPLGLAAGVGLGVMSAVMGRSQKAAVESTKRVNELTQAIENGTAAIGVWTNAQETGAAKATAAGLSQQEITKALMGTAAQYRAAQGTLDAYNKEVQVSGAQMGMFGASQQQITERQQQVRSETGKLKDALAQSRQEYEKAQKAAADYATQQGDSILAAQVQSGAIDKIAAGLGTTSSAYFAAKLAADKHTNSTKQATLAMQLEGDTAGLLTSALAGLAGKALSVGQAETNFHQAITSATTALKANGRTVDENTAKGQANRSAIESMSTANRSLVTAQLQGVHSSTQANRIIDTANATFKTNAARIYGAKSEAYKYAVQVGHIPHVAATDVRFNDGKARAKALALKQWIQSLNPVMTVSIHTIGAPNAGGAGKLAQRAGGGPVVKGTPYLVGEKGPEIFLSGQSGQIVPVGGRAGVPLGGGNTINLTVNAGLGTDATAVGRQIIGILEKTFNDGHTVAGGQRAMR